MIIASTMIKVSVSQALNILRNHNVVVFKLFLSSFSHKIALEIQPSIIVKKIHRKEVEDSYFAPFNLFLFIYLSISLLPICLPASYQFIYLSIFSRVGALLSSRKSSKRIFCKQSAQTFILVGDAARDKHERQHHKHQRKLQELVLRLEHGSVTIYYFTPPYFRKL